MRQLVNIYLNVELELALVAIQKCLGILLESKVQTIRNYG